MKVLFYGCYYLVLIHDKSVRRQLFGENVSISEEEDENEVTVSDNSSEVSNSVIISELPEVVGRWV